MTNKNTPPADLYASVAELLKTTPDATATREVGMKAVLGMGYGSAPGHTDLMVTPESIDAFIQQNPPPEPDVRGHLDIRHHWFVTLTLLHSDGPDPNARILHHGDGASFRFAARRTEGWNPEDDRTLQALCDYLNGLAP